MSCYDKMTSDTGMQQTNNHGRLVLSRKNNDRRLPCWQFSECMELK